MDGWMDNEEEAIRDYTYLLFLVFVLSFKSTESLKLKFVLLPSS